MARLTKGSFLMVGTPTGSTAVKGVYTVTLDGTWAATDTLTIAGQSIVVGSTAPATIASNFQAAFKGLVYTCTVAGAVLTFTETEGIEGIAGAPVAVTNSAAGTCAVATTTAGTAAFAYEKLCDITEYPDLVADLDNEDVTTLSHPTHVYIPALPDPGGTQTYNTWLSAADGAKIDALADEEQALAFYIGGIQSGSIIEPTGSVLKRVFKGYVAYGINGAGTAEAQPASVSVLVSTSPVNIWGTD